MIRQSVLIALVALVSMMLVGCEPVLAESGSVSIRRDGADLLIATCDPLSLEQFSVSARSQSEPFAKPVRVVTLEGSADLDAGHIYRVGDEMAGMKLIDSNSVDLDDLKDISVEASSQIAPYNPLFRVWDIEKNTLSDSVWLLPSGETAVEPCPHD